MILNNKNFFRIGFVCIVIFIVLASYFWYLYFHNYEKEMLGSNVAIEFINSGHIDYINATTEDPIEIIPTYYFRVKNNINKEFAYLVTFTKVSSSEVSDGCTDATTFDENELMYELKLDNRVIKTGLLSSIQNNILDDNKVLGNKTNNYSLRIWLSENAKDYQNKHYHYLVNFKER